ncbi:hypothetical protein HZC31_02210 [Candidatus Woesearchaeota archaeon]|nr:hypothetical protein [Candidatus Woesearchaeota archaeon]
MKKAELNFQLILFILAGFFLVFAAFVFVPNTIDNAKEFFEGLGFEFQEQTVPDQVIDEERIDADKDIPIEKVAQDGKSGYLVIIKQAYGEGWNLESAFHETFSEENKKLCGWWQSDEECAAIKESYAPYASNKNLTEILTLQELRGEQGLRGKIIIDGKNYIHIPQQHDYQWFKDTDNDEIYDGEDFTDTNNNGCWDQGEPLTDANNNKEYDGECITIEDLSKIILADLYTQATEE